MNQTLIIVGKTPQDIQETKLAIANLKEIQLGISKVLNSTERTIYYNQLSAPKLSWLTDVEFTNFIFDICSEIALLTGAPGYELQDKEEREEKNRLLVQSIEILLRHSESIMNLTTKEVRHALYLNHLGEFVRDGVAKEIFHMYGKVINAKYVGEVLDAYLSYRMLPSIKITALNRLLSPPEEKKVSALTLEDYKEWIQHDYEAYKSGHKELINVISRKYEFLRKLNIIKFTKKENWLIWYNKGREIYEIEVRKSLFKNDDSKRFNTPKKIEEIVSQARLMVDQETDRKPIIEAMRRLVYFEHFKRWNKQGVENIF